MRFHNSSKLNRIGINPPLCYYAQKLDLTDSERTLQGIEFHTVRAQQLKIFL